MADERKAAAEWLKKADGKAKGGFLGVGKNYEEVPTQPFHLSISTLYSPYYQYPYWGGVFMFALLRRMIIMKKQQKHLLKLKTV
jgi:hypothetical protein